MEKLIKEISLTPSGRLDSNVVLPAVLQLQVPWTAVLTVVQAPGLYFIECHPYAAPTSGSAQSQFSLSVK